MAKVVLVVDDDPDFLELLGAVLGPEGYNVVGYPDPAEALAKADLLCPDVIIVDLVMPGFSGWQLIERLKANPRTARIQVIVCTGAVAEATLQLARLRQWGCEVLLKPFELSDLLSTLERALARDEAC